MWSVVFALIPKKYLIGALSAVLICATLVAWIAHHQHALKAQWFQRGYAVAVDSAREATIVREIALRDSAASVAKVAAQQAADSTHAADSARSQFANSVQHTRIHVDPVPLTADTSLVNVTVVATGERIVNVPRRAAELWAESDSLLGVASQLLQRYAAANKQWAAAYASEHAARLASDSALALARQQPDTVYVPRHNAIRHDVMLLIDGALLYRFGPKLLAGLAHLHPHL